MSKRFCTLCGYALCGEFGTMHELSGLLSCPLPEQRPPVEPTSTLTRYVAGFMMTHDGLVALVHKNKPPALAGRLNGIGGKIEADESPRQAIVREFYEETSLHIDSWEYFCLLHCSPPGMGASAVYFFYTWQTAQLLAQLQTMETEEIKIVPDRQINTTTALPNVPWLLRMAASMQEGERAAWFEVTEHYE